MEVCQFEEQKEIDPILNMFKENCKQQHSENCSLTKIISNQKQILGYKWIYQYENHQIQLEYSLENQIWKIISQNLNFEEKEKLNILLNNINNKIDLSLDQQLQLLTQKLDQYFDELNQNENLIFKEEDEQITNLNNLSLNNSTILELDEEQTNFQQKFDCLIPPITSNRIRQDSSSSSTNSLKYAQFVPPSMVSIRRRRVIQSILLHVQRKKQVFEKVVDTLKHTPPEPTMYELGLEFLRIYDGKFNYPQGYTFVLSFKNRTWFLTINIIKCIECQLGESEPRSVLILQYKDKLTSIQV